MEKKDTSLKDEMACIGYIQEMIDDLYNGEDMRHITRQVVLQFIRDYLERLQEAYLGEEKEKWTNMKR